MSIFRFHDRYSEKIFKNHLWCVDKPVIASRPRPSTTDRALVAPEFPFSNNMPTGYGNANFFRYLGTTGIPHSPSRVTFARKLPHFKERRLVASSQLPPIVKPSLYSTNKNEQENIVCAYRLSIHLLIRYHDYS
jgi:hypothetical protein